MKTKKCVKCGETRPIKAFHKRSAGKDGLTARCSLCLNTKALQVSLDRPDIRRSYNLKQRFDMTIDQYNKMFLKQKGKCSICNSAETALDNKGCTKYLAVDHNHDTGAIRGLLCSSCNTGIGLLGDSVKTLKSAIKYLNKRGSYGK